MRGDDPIAVQSRLGHVKMPFVYQMKRRSCVAESESGSHTGH